MLRLIPYNPFEFPTFSDNPLVFIIDIPSFLPRLEKYASYLDIDEKIRAERFLQQVDRERFIIARGCLKEVLAYYLKGNSASNISFKTNPYGKLYLEDYPLHFNISHAHEKILIVVDQENEVGIDIEYQQREMEYIDLAKRFFHVDEYTYLETLKEYELPKAFFAIWSAKEAIIKCLGTGLAQELDQFSVLPAVLNGQAIINIQEHNFDAISSETEGYSLALARREGNN